METILTPLNHREIEYNAKRLSGCDIPDSLIYESSEARALFEWLEQTGGRVFDDDLVMDYGTDCLRLYLLFEKTPKENDAPLYESWNEGALEGMYKLLGRYRRMILAVLYWNRQGGYADITQESLARMQDGLDRAEKKIDKCIRRANDMPNRHNIVSALMELLNLLHKELKIGEIVTGIRQQEIAAAVPDNDREAQVRQQTEHEGAFAGDRGYKEEVTQICRKFIILMAPIACDMSKMLWVEMKL